MRKLWTLTAYDLLQRVRDRSVLIYGLVVPLALMYVFNLTFGGTEDLELQPVTVAAAVPPGDQLAASVVRALAASKALEIAVEEVAADEAAARVAAGDADVALVVPEGFAAQVMAGNGPAVEVTESAEAGLESDIVLSVVDGVLAELAAGSVAAAAAAEAGVPQDRLNAVAQRVADQGPAIGLVEGRASDEQLSTSGALVAGQAGLFLLFTVGFGVLSLVAEREQGTLARLRSMPMPAGLVVAAKALSGFLLGVVSTAVLLTLGSLFFDVSFGSPVAAAVLVLSAVAAGTSLTFIVARVARTSEQANTVQSIVALVLGIAGGAFFPITASGLAGRLVDLNPIAAFTRGLGITSGGGGLSDIGAPVTVMLGFAVVAWLASRLLPDRGQL
ncbi:MAG TPA: ABC transporter permease [Nocardioidaceae bacterium]|nr:ABC transporter permease [Nocardioidaceae bacterium]